MSYLCSARARTIRESTRGIPSCDVMKTLPSAQISLLLHMVGKRSTWRTSSDGGAERLGNKSNVLPMMEGSPGRRNGSGDKQGGASRDCSHGRLIEDVLTGSGKRTGKVRCLECGAKFEDPYHGQK